MKKIFFLLLCFVPIGLFGQVAFEMGAIKVDSIYMNESSDWWDEVSDDATFASPTNSQLPTALSVKTYITDTIPEWIHDSITLFQVASDVSAIVHDSLANVPNYEEDPVFAADSANLLHWADTVSYIATAYDLTQIDVSGGDGIVDTTGLPVAYQITYFTSADHIGGSSTFNFTGSTRTAASFYTGTTDPNTSDRLNWGGNLHAYKLTSITDIVGSVIKSNSSTRAAGNFYSGTTDPVSTTRLNYDGALWATSFNSTNASISSGGGGYLADTLTVGDSLRLLLFTGDEDVWLTLDINGNIDTAHTVAAAFMMQMKSVPTATERMSNMKDDEILWYYQKNGVIYETYRPDKLPPMLYLQTLQAAIELGVRNMAAIEQKQAEQDKRIAELEKQLGIKPKTKRFLFFKR